MGRQTSAALSEDDEREFLVFLRDGADIRILRWTAPAPEQIFVRTFPPRGPDQHRFRLWNSGFPWNPEFAQYGPERRDGAGSHFYLANTAGAPLIEYSREPFENPKAIVHGRVYWNTDLAIYRGLPYDVEAFNLWFSRVVRWLRKNGRRVEITKSWHQYWLPGAWQKRTAASEGISD